MAEAEGNGSSKAEESDSPSSFRAAVQQRVDAYEYERLELRHRLTKLLGRTRTLSARDAILEYLKLYQGQVVLTRELDLVSGIADYGRRIRELRVESGYKIICGSEDDSIPKNSYLLESELPDLQSAEMWKIANSVRRSKGSAKARILAYLKHHVGVPVSIGMLGYVAKIRETRRRTGELRTEDGWRLVTMRTGRPDLAGNEYVLESLEQLPIHDRKIPDEVYEDVLERDDFACQKCRWDINRRRPDSRRQFLEVHHVVMHAKGGTNQASNLITLCNVHHDVVHRQNIEAMNLERWLESGDDIVVD